MTHLNPELVKAAGDLVCANDPLLSVYLKTDGSNEVRIQRKCGGPGNAAMRSDREFNPLTSDSDAMKLERALKKEHWQFRYDSYHKFFVAEKASTFSFGANDTQRDPSDTLLLLKCVSAQTGIKMYLEGERDGR